MPRQPPPAETISSHIVARAADGKVVVELPIELLFTEDIQKVGKIVPDETAAWRDHNRIWADAPLGRLRPHVRLYQYFQSLAASPAEYLEWYRNLFRLRNLPPEFDDVTLLGRQYEIP